MNESTTPKNKHMSFDDRHEIQQCLEHGMTFKAIAARIGKDPTTVSKEVKKHITIVPSSVKRMNPDGTAFEGVCPQLLKAPFVCNGCKKRRTSCVYAKHLYYAKRAYDEYATLLREAREGIPLNKADFYEMDRLVSEGVEKGQHLYHIMHSHDLGVSKSTVYRHLKRGYLSVAAVDFPRVVKFKPRRTKPSEYVPKAAKLGRTYEDFLSFTEENGLTVWAEMDTVIGRIGGKVIMTLHFTLCDFMVGFLLESKNSAEVTAKILALKSSFVSAGLRFGDIFPLILTDNGGEFADVTTIENNLHGAKETSLFFCDPYKSCQKPNVEKNHTLFRDIVPKGQSFDGFSQNTVDLIFSHVNSVKRKILNGKTPYEMFAFTYGDALAKLLGIRVVPAEQVIQSPKLLNR
jgi:IS30 family transposase